MQINPNRSISSAHCSCKAGIVGQCKHTAALTIYVNETRDTTKTDNQQTWGIPKVKEGYSKGRKICDMFPASNSGHQCQEPASVVDAVKNFPDIHCRMFDIIAYEETVIDEKESRDMLNLIVNTVCEQELLAILQHLLSLETNIIPYQLYFTQLTETGIVFKKKTHPLNAQQKAFYEEKVIVTVQKILEYAASTIIQSKSSLWHSLRRIRITSSSCHSIITRKKNYEILANKMLQNRFTGNTATMYGHKMETAARRSFSFKQKVQVHCCGIVISKFFPWLACSPDGVFHENGNWKLLEIKCPYSRKENLLVDRDKKISFLRYIKFENDEWSLKKRCLYFSQIQIAMFVLGLKICSLYIYTSKDSIKINVSRDEEFLSEMLPKLQFFYFNYMLPILCN